MEKDYIEIDLLHLLQVLWRKIWIIVIAALVCGGIAFSYASFIIKPTYKASTMMYVNNSSISLGNTSFDISDINAAQSLVDTYIVILKTRTCLEEVIEKADLPYSYEQLHGMVSASACNGTEVFEISVVSTDPEEAKHIANTIAKVLPNKISNIVDGASVRVVDYAVTPSSKADPNVSKYTAIGLLAGTMISVAFILLQDFLDDAIHDDKYLSDTYPEIPVLAAIPDLGEESFVPGYYGKEKGKKVDRGGYLGNG